MEDLKLTQLSTSEFKLDSVVDFCLNSNSNAMTLIGNTTDVTVFELIYSCDSMVLMPYSNKQIPISQQKPISEVVKSINLVQIYTKASVQESQELALDPIYTAFCTQEPLKAKAVQADVITHNDTNICCILTTYGYCEIFKKDVINEGWSSLDTNLSNVLITEVFPVKVSYSDIKTYNDFKTFVNKFIITCFVLTVHVSDLIIFLGTAAGYVIALKYNETICKFELYCSLKTSLKRISHIVKLNNFVLVGCDQGKVLLVKINFDDIMLKEVGYLWCKSDRMSCRKALLNYSEDIGSYLVVFSKAAHLLAYRLDMEGVILSSSTLYVSGIKITGIESLSENEFIITTITGAIKYIKILCPTKEELYFEEQVINNEFDTSNYQILGVAATLSKNLWSFLLYRNKEYLFRAKYYTPSSAFVNVCKLSCKDSFSKLLSSNLRIMDTAQDLVLAINLDIFNNFDVNKYLEFLNLENIEFEDEINDKFVYKLQIKIIITRKLATYQNIKYKKIKPQIKNELQILEPAIQLLHILRRLSYLKKENLKDKTFSKFQELSIACMQLQFSHLLSDIAAIIQNEEQSNIRNIVNKFLKFFKDEFAKKKFDTSNFEQLMEYCIMCNQAIKNFRKCEQEHDIKRCTISFTQLTLFETKYCPHCYALARNDDAAKLKELYAIDDHITCIYCRFLLKENEF